MRNLFNKLSLRSVVCAGAIAAACFSAAPVSADYQPGYQPSYGVQLAPNQQDDYSNRPTWYYKEVTVYETRQVPDIQWITKYDHCGKPYQFKVVGYRTIKVPVKYRVKVAY